MSKQTHITLWLLAICFTQGIGSSKLFGQKDSMAIRLDTIRYWSEVNPSIADSLIKDAEQKKWLSPNPGREMEWVMERGRVHSLTGQMDLALSDFRRVHVLAQTTYDTLSVSKALNNIGALYSSLGMLDSAQHYYEASLHIKRKMRLHTETGIGLVNLANLTHRKGDLVEATRYYLQAITLFHQVGDAFRESVTRMNLGTSLAGQEFWDEALVQYKAARQLLGDTAYPYVLGSIYMNEGTAWMGKQAHPEAEERFQRAFPFMRNSGDQVGLALLQSNRGLWQQHAGNNVAARDSFLEALKSLDALGAQRDAAETRLRLAGAYSDLNKWNLALKMLKEAENYAQNYEVSDLQLDIFLAMSEAYQALHRPEAALACLRKAWVWRDSLVNPLVRQRAQEAQRKYFFEAQEKEILARERDNMELKAQKQHAETRNLWFGAGMVFLGFTAIMLSLLLRQYRRQARLKQELMVFRQTMAQRALQEKQERLVELEAKHSESNSRLSQLAMFLAEKNDYLQKLYDELPTILGKGADKSAIARAKGSILQALQIEPEREVLNQQLDESYRSFREELLKRWTDLTDREVRLCVLIRLGLSSKEMAATLNISPKSVDMARYRLRKKLQVEAYEDLEELLESL